MPAAAAQVGTAILKDLAKEAVQKQLQIIQEQQKKAMDFVNKKVKLYLIYATLTLLVLFALLRYSILISSHTEQRLLTKITHNFSLIETRPL